MNIGNAAVQTYQRNESQTNWAQQVDSPSAANDIDTNDSLDSDLSVSISDQRTIYQWIAQTYNAQLETSATISPVAQSLFDYGIIGVEEQRTINELSGENSNRSILQAVTEKLPNTESYREKSIMNGLFNVFSTLDAARTAS